MHIVFVTNYMNHHQRPFVEKMIELGCDVTVVSTERLPEERRAMGYSTNMSCGQNIMYDPETELQVHKICMSADAVIFGSKPRNLYKERVKSGKLTFNYSERIFKKGFWQQYSPRLQIKLRRFYLFDRKNAPYLLCAGDYAAKDYRSLGYPKNKFLKWGYFPPLTQVSLPELMQKKQKNTIVWVSRFIDWKHPEYVVELGNYLERQNIDFHIRMIGTGALLESIKATVEKIGLSDRIDVVGALPPEQVRQEFENAEIALLTSGRAEGWGAVINEAMNSGCATVVSNMVGSATYLVQNGINGVTFDNKKEMFSAVKQLLQNKKMCSDLGEKAFYTITDRWNYHIATERLLDFIEDQTVKCQEGPVSLG